MDNSQLTCMAANLSLIQFLPQLSQLSLQLFVLLLQAPVLLLQRRVQLQRFVCVSTLFQIGQHTARLTQLPLEAVDLVFMLGKRLVGFSKLLYLLRLGGDFTFGCA